VSDATVADAPSTIEGMRTKHREKMRKILRIEEADGTWCLDLGCGRYAWYAASGPGKVSVHKGDTVKRRAGVASWANGKFA